jgi:hypothetical protein
MKKKDKVVIIVEGGLVQTVYAKKGTQIEVLDFDGEGEPHCPTCKFERKCDCDEANCNNYAELSEEDINKITKGLKQVY